MSNEEPTEERLFRLLREEVVRDPDIKTPEMSRLKDLASEIDWLHHSYQAQLPIARDAQKNLERLLSELLEHLPSVIRTNDAMRKRHPGTTDAQGEALKSLEAAASRVYNVTGVGWNVFPEVQSWRNFAVPLARTFCEVMQSVNPGLEIRPSNTGAVSRFMFAVIPWITEENPSGETVVRHIQREEKNGNTSMSRVTV